MPASGKPLAALEPHQSALPVPGDLKGFWALMDRWGVPDEKALQLLDHVGGLTAAGKRPRFGMTSDEAKRFAYLTEIDTAAQAIFGETGPWLVRKNKASPFGGSAPLEHMIKFGERGLADIHRFLVRQAMLASRPASGRRGN
jgi:hypothetical protein